MTDTNYNSFTKQPSEAQTRSITFVDRLPVGATVASATVAVIDLTTNETVSTSRLQSTTGTVATPVVSFTVLAGGEAGRDYKITVLATLSSNAILEEDIIMEVREF